MAAIDVQGVTKRYATTGPGVLALDNLSLKVAPGTIHGLLGPNGAGKSTLISLISGMALPTEGHLEVFGTDVVKHPTEVKRQLGVVPQELVVEMAFTVREVLHYFAGMYGVPLAQRRARIDEVLEDVALTDKADEKARALSGGMKRRLMMAKAMMHKPKLLILDEPTAGVDVALRQRIWELVRRLHSEGTTILFTTHYLEEAEKLCERLTIVGKGKVLAEGTLDDLRTSHGTTDASLESIFLSLTN